MSLTHCNYVLAFTDGSVKVGVTSRPQARVVELCRGKRNEAKLVVGMLTPLAGKEVAFKTEADLCRLVRRERIAGSREWFHGEYDHLKAATGMFWQMNTQQKYTPVEVAA